SGGAHGRNRKTDDNSGDAYFGEAVDVVNQLAAEHSGEEALRLFEIGAEKAGVRKSAEMRLRHVRACAERSCVPVIIEPAKIDRRPSPSRRQWQRLDAFIASVTVKLEKISRWVAKINQRG